MSEQASQLAGGTVIWIFVALELLTFGMFFVAFAATRQSDPQSFLAGQQACIPRSAP